MAALIDIEIDQKIKNIHELTFFLKSLQLPTSHELENIYFITQQLRKNTSDKTLKSLIKNCLLFQLESLRQEKKSTKEELKNITWNKCGYSFLLSRMLLKHTSTKREEELCYQYGGIGQLGDDILDIYDDKKEGIETLPHILNNKELEKLYMDELYILFRNMQGLPYKSKNIRKAARKLCIVTAIPLVQLDLLKQNNIETGKAFSIENKKRENTICDMQKLSTITLCFHKAVNMYKLFINLKKLSLPTK